METFPADMEVKVRDSGYPGIPDTYETMTPLWGKGIRCLFRDTQTLLLVGP